MITILTSGMTVGDQDINKRAEELLLDEHHALDAIGQLYVDVKLR